MNSSKQGTALARIAQSYARAQDEVEKVCMSARDHLPPSVPDEAIPSVLAAIAATSIRVPPLSAPKQDLRKQAPKRTRAAKPPTKAQPKPQAKQSPIKTQVLSMKATLRMQSNARFSNFLKFLEARGVSGRFLPAEAAEAVKVGHKGVGGVLSRARKQGLVVREPDGSWKVLHTSKPQA